MKTIDELYKEIRTNEALKEEFLQAVGNGTGGDFLKKHGCDASHQDIMDYAKGLGEVELSEDDLENVSGGCKPESDKCHTFYDCYTSTAWCDISC